MAEKRKSEGGDHERKSRSSKSAQVWSKRTVEGPGIWVSCVKGKEKQTVGEIYDIFESVASRLYSKSTLQDGEMDPEETDTGADGDVQLSLEDQVARELTAMKRPRKTNRDRWFANCQTNTPCVAFISCQPPVVPVDLVMKYVREIEESGAARTKYVHRLLPVSDSCATNLPEIQSLCRKVFGAFFDKHGDTKFTYKIEIRIRNHTTIQRHTLIENIAQCVPVGHTVDLHNPRIFLLVEVFKGICGVSVVEDYYRWHKFNVMEIANQTKKELPEESRLITKSMATIPNASPSDATGDSEK